MGASQEVTSKQRFDEAEAKILSFSGLSSEEIRISEVEIYEGCTIHTIEGGFEEQSEGEKKPLMVFIHGYGASGALFYPIMKGLSEHYHLILFDIIGMGGSTRWPFVCENAEDAEQYFLDSVEKWRIAMGELTDFYLVGHSFGGYLAGLYASFHP